MNEFGKLMHSSGGAPVALVGNPARSPLRNGPLCDLSVGLGAQGQAGGGGRSIIRSIILGRLPVGSGPAK